MLIDIGGQLLNTDLIRSVKTIDGRPDDCTIVWSNGDEETISYSSRIFDRITGVYVVAAPGYTQVTAYVEDGEVSFYDPIPIIAFRVSGQSHYDVEAVTLEGEASQYENPITHDVSATVFPDGRCFDHREGGLPMSLEEWKRDATRTLKRKAGVA